MPVREYELEDGSVYEDLFMHDEPDPERCPKTGLRVVGRKVSPVRVFIPHCFRIENEEVNARQKAWVESPETQARIKSGELVPHTDLGHEDDVPEATSSVIERAKLGVL